MAPSFLASDLKGSVVNAKSIVALFLSICILYRVTLIIYNLFFHPLRKYPGPKSYAISRIPFRITSFLGNEVREIARLHEKYGPVVRIGPSYLSYIDPGAWKEIQGHRSNGKPAFLQGIVNNAREVDKDGNPLVPSMIRTVDIHEHARQRKIFAHAFSEKALREQEPLIKGYVDYLIKRLREETAGQKERYDGKPVGVDMVKWYNLTTFDIMADLTFGEALGLLKAGQYNDWVASIFGNIRFFQLNDILNEFPLLKLCATWLVPKSFAEKRKKHIKYGNDLVDKRLSRDVERPDIWSLVVRNEQQMPKREMYANALVFMLAGTETTATLLAGVTYLLCKHPDKLARLQAEVRQFKSSDDLHLAELPQLEYLHACLKEALRIYPPVPVLVNKRSPPGGATIFGELIPEETKVGIPHFAAYHSTMNFIDPEEYIPERWLPDADERFAGDNKTAVQPFHVGPRGCLGVNLAWHEMRLTLSTLIWHFDISLVDEKNNWLDQRVFSLWEKKPLNVKLAPVVR